MYTYIRPTCGWYKINIDHTMHENSEDWAHVVQKILQWWTDVNTIINTLSAELNPICHLLALLGAHHILHISRIRVNVLV